MKSLIWDPLVLLLRQLDRQYAIVRGDISCESRTETVRIELNVSSNFVPFFSCSLTISIHGQSGNLVEQGVFGNVRSLPAFLVSRKNSGSPAASINAPLLKDR